MEDAQVVESPCITSIMNQGTAAAHRDNLGNHERPLDSSGSSYGEVLRESVSVQVLLVLVAIVE